MLKRLKERSLGRQLLEGILVQREKETGLLLEEVVTTVDVSLRVETAMREGIDIDQPQEVLIGTEVAEMIMTEGLL